MASHAFKDGDLISKVTIMIFSEDFLFGGEIRFLRTIKKAVKATFQ